MLDPSERDLREIAAAVRGRGPDLSVLIDTADGTSFLSAELPGDVYVTITPEAHPGRYGLVYQDARGFLTTTKGLAASDAQRMLLDYIH